MHKKCPWVDVQYSVLYTIYCTSHIAPIVTTGRSDCQLINPFAQVHAKMFPLEKHMLSLAVEQILENVLLFRPGVGKRRLASRMQLFKSLTAAFLTPAVFVYGDVLRRCATGLPLVKIFG